MTARVKRFARNEAGRDYVVGDIHGTFSKLHAELVRIGFNFETDRLFSVGDLVDRGPECDKAIEWLDFPWFHPVQGNHEDMAIRWPNGHMDAQVYIANGGAWNVGNTPEEQRRIADVLSALPIAIEVETGNGLIGIVHADCPCASWQEFTAALEDESLSKNRRNAYIDAATWSRDRISSINMQVVAGAFAVFVGHTPVSAPCALGNVVYIDTGGWMKPELGGNGYFTVIELDSLAEATT